MKKLLGDQSEEESDLNEIYINYLLSILMKDRITLETLLKQSHDNRSVFIIDNEKYA